jgi:hypothetical protein
MSSFRAFLAVLGLSCLVAACTPTGQQATPEPVEAMPPAAFLHLVGDPPTAARPIVVKFAAEDGDRSGQSFAFVEGQPVVIDRTSIPEIVSAWVDEVACAGSLRVVGQREIDGILTVGEDECALVATRNHPVGDVVHPDLSGSLSAQAPLGTTLTLTSLDGAIPGEVSDDADESGWISLAVPAGRWRAVLARGSETLDESTLTVEGGETIHLDLRTP